MNTLKSTLTIPTIEASTVTELEFEAHRATFISAASCPWIMDAQGHLLEELIISDFLEGEVGGQRVKSKHLERKEQDDQYFSLIDFPVCI